MKGYKEVKCSIIKLLNNCDIEYKVKDIDYGFYIDINKYPYGFKISCMEEFGWNVFLEIKEEIFIEHPETDKLYKGFEDIINKINYEFYGLDKNVELLVKKNRKKISYIIEKYSEMIDIVEEEELKTILKLKEIDGKKPEMSINYSISMGIWTLRIDNFFKGTNIYDNLFTIFTEANSLIQEFNNEKNSLSLF